MHSFSCIIYTTHLNNVLSANSDLNESNNEIDPCNHEEAYTRALLHAAHAARNGHRKVVLRTVDTDVVVLAIFQMHNLQLLELWLEFGVGKRHRVIPAHSITVRIGSEKASALPFSGCDTTSAFSGRCKKLHGTSGVYFLKLHLHVLFSFFHKLLHTS